MVFCRTKTSSYYIIIWLHIHEQRKSGWRGKKKKKKKKKENERKIEQQQQQQQQQKTTKMFFDENEEEEEISIKRQLWRRSVRFFTSLPSMKFTRLVHVVNIKYVGFVLENKYVLLIEPYNTAFILTVGL